MARMARTARSIGLCFSIPSLALAQSSPVDLIELSIDELMQVKVVRLEDQEPLHVGYRYLRSEFEHYRDGTDRIPASDILGPLGPKTYPIIQTAITQQAHLFDVGYDINKSWSIDMVVPYIKQSTDHVSVLPDFEFFVMGSE